MCFFNQCTIYKNELKLVLLFFSRLLNTTNDDGRMENIEFEYRTTSLEIHNPKGLWS